MRDIVTELPTVLINASKETLYRTGELPRPQVHMLAEDMDNPYIGYSVCRRFYRGTDCVTAIADLGRVPSTMKMTRLMVMWERADLAVALEETDHPTDYALMLVDASLAGHTFHEHPFHLVPTGDLNADGVPALHVEWDQPTRHDDAPLPEPIARLLDTWRAFDPVDWQQTVVAQQEKGYAFFWTRRG
ncbi:hypothetical protein ACFYOT_25160 [Saccharothrix saharensis]|uniref:hypothetical protein n=1 Tax=Saccharothrix saharensis TaxID=571190 RepID=UPI0036C77018